MPEFINSILVLLSSLNKDIRLNYDKEYDSSIWGLPAQEL